MLKKFHCFAIDVFNNKEWFFTSRPNISSLLKKLENLSLDKSLFRICYEAGYIGYTLQRDLKANAYECQIVAPSLIPKLKGKMVKTDRVDCKKLAWMYMKGLLTPINVPEIDDEMVRDLIRTRMYLQEKLRGLKKHILALCRRMNINFKQETGLLSYWTLTHLKWLDVNIKKQNHVLKFNLCMLLKDYHNYNKTINLYDEEILKISLDDMYLEKVQSLICYRGLDTISAMSLVCELGDIKRFSHPKKLISYIGFDIREYSSGGRETKFGITKIGNKSMRKTLIQACQKAIQSPRISAKLKRRRKSVAQKYIDISDRCMKRLNQKGIRLIYRGKHTNKVKTACAREMIGFIWESLNLVQASL